MVNIRNGPSNIFFGKFIVSICIQYAPFIHSIINFGQSSYFEMNNLVLLDHINSYNEKLSFELNFLIKILVFSSLDN